jgi:ABC-type uncharacterized transport system permease subunit
VTVLRRSGSQLARTLLTIGPALLIVIGALVIILLIIDKSPSEALNQFIQGSLGNDARRSDVLMMALPILLCASGLLITFTAGLWNIGIEGQVTMGAIFATALARLVVPETRNLIALPLELLLSMVGGALWAAVAALLKTKGNVNEIFGGVALNFVAANILLFLLNGSWQSGSYPQTAPFDQPALLPRMDPALTISIPAIVVALVGFAVVFFVLRGTHWGLQLRAMGRSEKSAFLLGVRTQRNVMLSMMFCGALAGLAGALLVLSPISRGKLVPGISGGIGFLAVLVVLLVNLQPLWVPLVALFFAIVPIGTLRLQNLAIDPSLGNVFQSAMVLAVLLMDGVRRRLRRYNTTVA